MGKIRVKDIADITVVDNQGDAYSKVNGENAILLSVFKGSTANTSTVSKGIQNSFKDLEKKYKGLSFTTIMNQGDYINIIIKSVLSSILLGAVLAIIVLALFLKDIRPTIVVAFSIPFSVLFAIIIMYFTGININVMSLAGLCLGIGMLVDNSIVVMENIYRFRNEGMSASKAAVRGTAQVAGPILASTITTICVFLPMIYTSGMVSQLLMPFAFTISYALIASLLVALTVVPTMGSVLLRKTKDVKQPWFDKIKDVYGKVLELALRFKVSALDGNASVTSSMLGTGTTDNYTSFSFNIITEDNIKTTKEFRKIRKEIERKTKRVKCKEITVSSSAMGDMSSLSGGGLSVNVYGEDQQKLIKISEDVIKMMKEISEVKTASNGIESADKMLHLKIDRNKAAEHGLTIAQIYQEILKHTTTEKNAITLNMDEKDVEVNLINETDKLTYENILDMKIETTEKNSDGEDEKHTYKLSDFASEDDGYSMDNITRENQKPYLTVTAEIDENANATLLSRKLQNKIDKYKAPGGY